MNKEEFLNHPEVAALSPEKRQIIQDFLTGASGLTIEKALPILLQTNARMKSLGISFTPQETGLMFDLLTSDMSDSEKAKANALRKLLQKKANLH